MYAHLLSECWSQFICAEGMVPQGLKRLVHNYKVIDSVSGLVSSLNVIFLPLSFIKTRNQNKTEGTHTTVSFILHISEHLHGASIRCVIG